MAEIDDGLEVGGGEGEGEQRPDWLPQEFDSGEALAKSYAESRRLIEDRGRETNEANARAEEAEEQLAAYQQQGQPQYGNLSDNPLVTRYSRAFEEGDVVEMMRVQAEIAGAVAAGNAPKEREQDFSMLTAFAENQVRQADPEYDQYREQVYDVLKANPQLMPQGATLDVVQQGIQTALDVARGQALHAERQTQAQKDAQDEAARQAKLQAQTVPGGGTRPASADESANAWDKIVAAGRGGRLTLP